MRKAAWHDVSDDGEIVPIISGLAATGHSPHDGSAAHRTGRMTQ